MNDLMFVETLRRAHLEGAELKIGAIAQHHHLQPLWKPALLQRLKMQAGISVGFAFKDCRPASCLNPDKKRDEIPYSETPEDLRTRTELAA